jgi:hypothetical protein
MSAHSAFSPRFDIHYGRLLTQRCFFNIQNHEMTVDPQTDEIRIRDKRVVAVHEASHAFVGGALGLSIESVMLYMNPKGGLEEKHWLGSTKWLNHLEECLNMLPPDRAKWDALKWRLFSLAGYIGECMFTSHAGDPPAGADEILDWLKTDWESLSESDRRAFARPGSSATEREVEAVLYLLGDGRELVLEIADKLEIEEILDRDALFELLSYRVFIPDDPDLLDFRSWEICKS